MSTQVELTNVSKIYRMSGLAVPALQGINLQVGRGEFVVLAGPSGSGKSTLLHLVGALDAPSEGELHVADRDLTHLSRRELAEFRLRKIGFVFQAYNLIPVLTAQENVEYTLLLQGVDRSERERRSLELLEKVGLQTKKNQRPGELSGGQQQRVAIARALATRPEIVLADEPTANLDSQTGSSLIHLFKELNRQIHTTFLLASHDAMVIEQADRVVRLKDGRIV